MESIETWVRRIIELLRTGVDRHAEVLKMIQDASSEEHLDRLHRMLTDLNWYGRLGPEFREGIRSRRVLLQAEADSGPSP